MNKQPIKLLPAFRDYLWGGTKLKTEFKKVSDLEKIAESWELSTHKDGNSIVASGEFAGLNLYEYIKAIGEDCIGSNAKAFEFFPILIKFIDASDNLSIQVHPSDEYALKNEGQYGKTEMWYILDCEEDAFIYYGVNKEISKEEFRKYIEENKVLDVLNKVKVKKGDVFFIDSGTIHAIGKGIMICEIQQNSNLTYRVYDYDRRDKDGKARELHIDKACDVANLTPSKLYKTENENILAKCKYFTVEKLICKDKVNITLSNDSFKSLIAVSGEGKICIDKNTLEFSKGDSIFIPAQDGVCKVFGDCELIISYV